MFERYIQKSKMKHFVQYSVIMSSQILETITSESVFSMKLSTTVSFFMFTSEPHSSSLLLALTQAKDKIKFSFTQTHMRVPVDPDRSSGD